MKIIFLFLSLSFISSVSATTPLNYNCTLEMRRDDNVILGKVSQILDLNNLQNLKIKNWHVDFGVSSSLEYGEVTPVVLRNKNYRFYHSFQVPRGTTFISFYRSLYRRNGTPYNQIWLDCKRL